MSKVGAFDEKNEGGKSHAIVPLRDSSARFLTYDFSHQKYPPGSPSHTLKSFRLFLRGVI